MSKPRLILFGDPKRPHAAEAVERFVAFANGKAEILANCFESGCNVEVFKKSGLCGCFRG